MSPRTKPEVGANCIVAEETLKWHGSLEVEEDHRTLAGKSNRNKRRRWEWSPFDLEERLRISRLSEETPEITTTAPMMQIRPPTARGLGAFFYPVSTTKKRRGSSDLTKIIEGYTSVAPSGRTQLEGADGMLQTIGMRPKPTRRNLKLAITTQRGDPHHDASCRQRRDGEGPASQIWGSKGGGGGREQWEGDGKKSVT
jgi:hypothetical protein